MRRKGLERQQCGAEPNDPQDNEKDEDHDSGGEDEQYYGKEVRPGNVPQKQSLHGINGRWLRKNGL